MNIKKLILGMSSVLVSLSFLFVVPAFAAPDSLHQGSFANAGQCPSGGTQVLNVTWKVINDADSGYGGYWAFDNYNKRVQVWDEGDSNFCAVVKYDGQFVTIDGKSPSGTLTVGAGVKGTFQGGYMATFTFDGSFNPEDNKTNGSLGLKNYDCNSSGSCTGLFSWLSTYFPGYSSFSYPNWAWIYRAGNNGTWLNAASGSLGDITGN